MSVFPQHIEELLRWLETSPELRAMLRSLLLSEELLALPGTVQKLAAAEKRLTEQLRGFQATTERVITALAQRIDQLATRVEAQIAALSERMEQVEAQIAALVERMGQAEQRLDELEQLMERVEQRLDRVEHDLARLKGLVLPLAVERRIGGLFRPLLRSARLVSDEELTRLVDEAEDRGFLSESEAEQLLAADLVVRGRDLHDRARQISVACEVSWGVGPRDVTRAKERAAILTRIGYQALPAIRGAWITPEGEAERDGVAFLLAPESFFDDAS